MSVFKKAIVAPKAAPAVGPYSHAVKAGGLLFCSGQIPIDPANPAQGFAAMDIRAQTEQVLKNISAILEHEGLSLEHVVKTTVFMTNLADFGAMNEVYAHHFKSEYPARSTVQVAALPKGAQVEIEVVAVYPR